MHTIKPLDKDQVVESSKKTKIFFSVEEHNIIGGLGSAIAEVSSNLEASPKLIRLGLKDSYSESGEYSYILEKNNLTVEKILDKIIKEVKN